MKKPRIQVIGLVALLASALAYAREPNLVPIKLPQAGTLQAPRINTISGGFLMSWVRETQPGNFVLEFAENRQDQWGPVRSIAQGKNWFNNPHENVGVVPLDDNRYLGYWLVRSGPSTYDYAIRMRTLQGRRLSEIFSPHAELPNRQHGFLAFGPSKDKGVRMIWVEGGNNQYKLIGASLLGTGELTPPTTIDGNTCSCCQPDTGTNADNNWFAIYRDRTADEQRDIAMATAMDDERFEISQIHADGWIIDGCPINGPVVANSAGTNWAAWFTGANNQPRVLVGRLENGVVKLPIQLNKKDALGQVAITDDGADQLYISWISTAAAKPTLMLSTLKRGVLQQPPLSIAPMPEAPFGGAPQLISTNDTLIFLWQENAAQQGARLFKMKMP